MEITYCSAYSDILRCTLYSLPRRRDLLPGLAIPILPGAFSLGHQLAKLGWLAFPAALAIWTIGMFVVSFLTLQGLIVCRLLLPKVRRTCTTTLTLDGFTDVRWGKTHSFPWSAFSEIRFHQGDIFFWRKGKDGLFVPRSAFATAHQSRLFYEQSVSLWNEAKNLP